MSLAEVQREKAERRSDEAHETTCKRCGAPVLTALAGRSAALRVYADPAELDRPAVDEAQCQRLLTWCVREGLKRRITWRCETRRMTGECGHAVIADHECEDRKGRKVAAKDDPFGTEKDAKRPQVKRDRYGRYVLTHPATGKEQGWQRVTTFCKITSDQFNLTQWQMRNVAVGIAKREDLSALASTLDIKDDAKQLNGICEKAKEAAGGTSAANTGTALHAMTESHDETGSLRDVAEVYRPRIAEYAAALKQAGIIVLTDMIERIVVHAGYDVAGTFDRVVQLADGTYCVLDLKTGRDLSYAWSEIAVQLALYADGFNAHGVWDADGGEWTDRPFKVRDDFAIVVHMPAAGTGVMLYKLDLEHGRQGAELCRDVRAYRKAKAAVGDFDGFTPGADELPDPAPRVTWLDEISAAQNMESLLYARDRIKAWGGWNAELAAACKARAAQLKGTGS